MKKLIRFAKRSSRRFPEGLRAAGSAHDHGRPVAARPRLRGVCRRPKTPSPSTNRITRRPWPWPRPARSWCCSGFRIRHDARPRSDAGKRRGVSRLGARSRHIPATTNRRRAGALLCDLPFGPKNNDQLYGAEDSADIWITRANSATFLDAINTALFPTTDAGRITEIRIYAPPIMGGTLTPDGTGKSFWVGGEPYGTATIRVAAEKRDSAATSSRRQWSGSSSRRFRLPGPSGALQALGQIGSHGTFNVNWGAVESQNAVNLSKEYTHSLVRRLSTARTSSADMTRRRCGQRIPPTLETPPIRSATPSVPRRGTGARVRGDDQRHLTDLAPSQSGRPVAGGTVT